MAVTALPETPPRGGEEPLTTAVEKDGFVHIDRISFGIYEFPLDMVEVDESAISEIEIGEHVFRACKLAGLRCQLRGTAQSFCRNVRTNPNLHNVVFPWIHLAPSTAPIVLLSAIPGFWLGRFRLARQWNNVKAPGDQCLDLAQLMAPRRKLRERLVQHAASLQSKLCSLRYHRSNFHQAVEDAARESYKKHPLIRATAEFAAHESCAYSFLEELTRVLSCFEKIRNGTDVPTSFHGLYEKRDKLAPDLSRVLTDVSWYESFRLRRANATHAFGAVVSLSAEENDLFLHQHPDRLIVGSALGAWPQREKPEAAFNEQVRELDRFLSALSAYLLTLFHPWDAVILNLAPPDSERKEQRAVWVRGVWFDPSLETRGTGWGIGEVDGTIAIRTDQNGGLTTAHSRTLRTVADG
ncbi:MAG: hypothetical protein ACHQ9S_10960 [Candidatus Binatia bacterium]